MSLKHGLLGLLSHGSMSGYELDKVFRESLNFFWAAETSQVYRELNAMEKSGWLYSETVIQTERPNKKVYSITETGKEELGSWLCRKEFDKELKVRNAFLMRLFLSGRKPVSENIDLLALFKERYKEKQLGLSGVPESIRRNKKNLSDKKEALYWQLTADFGERYNRMCIDWAEDAIRSLEEAADGNDENTGS